MQKKLLPVVVDLMVPVLLRRGQYLHDDILLQGFSSTWCLRSLSRVLVDACMSVSPVVLLHLRPKTIVASLISRVPFERSRYFKFLVTISLIGGLLGLLVVIKFLRLGPGNGGMRFSFSWNRGHLR